MVGSEIIPLCKYVANMKIYLIPGLGFDQRIFEKLDLGEHHFSYINWLEPKRNEKLAAYALRMSEFIQKEQKDSVLIGHSFGGIIGQEISKIRPIKKVILLSSIRSRAENPLYFKMVSHLALHKLFTKSLITRTVKLWGNRHGYETVQEQQLLKDMVSQYSNHYLQWALKTLSQWEGTALNNNLPIVQIHGALDKTFPLRLIKKPDHIIDIGGHFMVYKKPELISEILKRELGNKPS